MIQKEREFRERCALRGLDGVATEKAVGWVRRLVEEAAGYDGGLATAPPETFKRFASLEASAADEAPDRLLAYARYCLVIGREDLVVWLYSVILPIGVLPAVAERLAALEGEELRELVFRGVAIPPPGAPPEAYPAPTAVVVSRLEPTSVRAGGVVLASTVVLGMLWRHTIAGDGTPAAFVLVATAFLALSLLGWRLVVALVRRRAAARP